MEKQPISDHSATPETTDIGKGLIIALPWVRKILRGEKVWEMRSSHTSARGPIALIEKGSGTIVGIANILNSIGPLSFDEIFRNEEKHRVGPEIYTHKDFKWNYAWLLGQVTPLTKPVTYRHKSGAVIWVELDSVSRTELHHQLTKSRLTSTNELSVRTAFPSRQRAPVIDLRVPFARDDSWFCKEACSRSGHYTVGEKGFEQSFSSYESALNYLGKMATAKWRRPNAKGNWGIVSAVRWDALE